MNNNDLQGQIDQDQREFVNCTYSYIYNMYRLERADETHQLVTYHALPRWAKQIWRLNRLDLARGKRDSGKMTDISKLPDILQPKSKDLFTSTLPARIKWLQDLPLPQFERAVNRILNQLHP